MLRKELEILEVVRVRVACGGNVVHQFEVYGGFKTYVCRMLMRMSAIKQYEDPTQQPLFHKSWFGESGMLLDHEILGFILQAEDFVRNPDALYKQTQAIQGG